MLANAFTHDLTIGFFAQGLLSEDWSVLAREHDLNLVEKQVFYLYLGIGTTPLETQRSLGISALAMNVALSSICLKFGVATAADLARTVEDILARRDEFRRTLNLLL